MEKMIKEIIKNELEGELLNSLQDIEENGETQFETYDIQSIKEARRDWGVFDLQLPNGDIITIDWWLEQDSNEAFVLTYELEVF